MGAINSDKMKLSAHKGQQQLSTFINQSLKSLSVTSYKYVEDESLVKLVVEKNDHNAFREILLRYTDKVLRLAVRITKSPSDAEDVLQNVSLTLYKKLHTYRGDAKFSTWLYRLASNACLLYLRSERRHSANISLDGDFDPDYYIKPDCNNSTPENIVQKKEQLDLIKRAMNELPEHYRVVFELREFEGLKNEQVSKMLDISLAAVKSRTLRARHLLKTKLNTYMDAAYIH